MAGQNPSMVIRVAATIAELKANLAEGKSQIETTTAAMQKLAASFSGDKLIQAAHNVTAAVDAIGGAGKLTESEMARVNATIEKALDKYRALGKEAPAGMQQLADATRGAVDSGETWTTWLGKANTLLGAFGLALSVGAVVNFGRVLLDSADALTKLHDRTSISIAGLQRFQIVGDDAGNTIEEMSAAIVIMQDRIAGGDKSAIAALRKLGVDLEAFKSLSPEAQFIAWSDAIRGTNDSGLQLNATIDLMGKAGAAVLPSLKRGFDDVKDSTVGMSAESVRALDLLGDSLTKLWRITKDEIFGELAARMVQNVTDPLRWKAMAAALDDATAAAEKAAPKFAAVAPPGLPEDLAAIEQELTDNAKALIEAGLAAEKAATSYRAFQNWLGEREIENHAKQLAAQEKQETAYRAYQNWLGERFMQDELARMKQIEEDNAKHLAVMAAQAANAMIIIGAPIPAGMSELTRPQPLERPMPLDQRGVFIPSFDTGVTNFSGGLARVHKDEMLVNLPRGTDVIPAGGGGAVIVNLNVGNFIGSDYTAARALTDMVAARVMQTLGSQRKLDAS